MQQVGARRSRGAEFGGEVWCRDGDRVTDRRRGGVTGRGSQILEVARGRGGEREVVVVLGAQRVPVTVRQGLTDLTEGVVGAVVIRQRVDEPNGRQAEWEGHRRQEEPGGPTSRHGGHGSVSSCSRQR